jgi:alpha,alpha-trehalase
MLNVTSPGSNASHTLAHYSVTNTAPRPESYYQDYMTANDPTLPTLSESQKEDLYGQLASGAETGMSRSCVFAVTSTLMRGGQDGTTARAGWRTRRCPGTRRSARSA